LMLAGIQSGKTYSWDEVSRRLGDSYFGGMIPGAAMGGFEAAGQHGTGKQEGATESPVIDQVLSTADENGLVRVDALPGMIRDRLRQERPDTIRPGGLFSGDKVHASVVEDMLQGDAMGNQPPPGKAVGDTPSVTGGFDIEGTAQDLMSAQTPDELTQKMESVLGSGLMRQEAPAAPESAQQDVIGATAQGLQEAPQEGSTGLTETIDKAFPETVRRGDGRPFSTEAAADTYARHQGITDFTVTQDGEGFALRTKKAPKLEQEAGTPGAQLESDVAELVSEPAPAKPRIKGKPAVATERMIPLTHWGNTAGLTELDPAHHGEGAMGAEKNRKGDGYLNRTYYGMPGYQLEDVVASRNKARYFTSVPARELYDLAADPDGLRAKAEAKAKAREDEYFARKGYRLMQPVTATDVENEVKLAGYRGYFVGDVAALFDKQPVKEVTNEPMDVVGVAGYDERGSQKQSVSQKASETVAHKVAEEAPTTPIESKPAAPKKEAPAAEITPAPGENAATVEDFQPGRVKDLGKKTDWAMLTAENPEGKPASENANADAMARLKVKLRKMGKKFVNVKGKYGGEENSLGVVGITEKEAVELGKLFKQDSVLTPTGLVYMDGRPPTRATGKVEEFTPTAKDDLYSTTESGASFRVGLDWGDVTPETETVGGDTLADLLPKGKVPLGISKKFAESIAAALNKRFSIAKTGAININVAGTVEDLPETVKAKYKGRNVLNRLRADYDPVTGTIWFVARNFRDKGDFVRTYLHEVGLHAGLRYMFGAKLDNVLSKIVEDHGNLVLEKLSSYGLDDTPNNRLTAAEEILGRMSEDEPTLGLVQRARAVVRNFIRSLGINLKLNDNDLNYIIQATRDAAKTGRSRAAMALRGLYDAPVAKRETQTVSALNHDTSLEEAASLNGANQLAHARKWKNQTEFKSALQDAVLATAEREGIDPRVYNEKTHEYLVKVGLDDAITAIGSNKNAVGWYDQKTRHALAIMSLVHPEIATSEDARFAAISAIAITSNGNLVNKNFEIAEKAYDYYKKNGRMPTDIGVGEAAPAINKSMGLFNDLINAWGPENFRKFMLTDFTVKEIAAINKDLKPSGELAGTTVRGAAIFGPKIGNGFFSNLYGKFDALTMDRWLVRTWGRWTGTLLVTDEQKVKAAEKRLSNAIADVVDQGGGNELGKILKADLENKPDLQSVTTNARRISMTPDGRAAIDAVPGGNEFRKAANRMFALRDEHKETPQNGTERNHIRAVFGDVLEQLRKRRGYGKLTMADLQAVMWYAEKRLYETSKQATQRSKKVTGYSEEEAPDYANAAAALAKSKGFTDDQINEAIKRSDDEQRDGGRVGRGDVGTGRPAGARRGDAGLSGNGAQPVRGNEGQARGFTPQERIDFERERAAARAAGAKYSVIDQEAQHHAELAQTSPEREDRIRRKVENVSSWFAKHDGVDVVGTVDDLPFEAPPNARAAAWKGRVYIVADAFSSKAEARDAYAHELVGHLKAEQVEGYSDILTEVANEQNRTGVIKDTWQAEQAKRPWAAPDELAREVVAVLAERESKHPLIRRLVNLYRGILKRFGAINPTEGKIYDIIAKAYRGTNVTHDNTPWFSVSTPGVTDRALYKAAMQFVDDTTALGKAEEITGVKDIRREVLLQRSYVVNDVDAALDKFVKPMELQRRKYGFTSEQVSKFLHARHAWEANDQLRLRNIERMKKDGIIPQTVDPTDPLLDLRTIPGMMDQSNPKYGYWNDLWEAPAGMTDADAHDIMREWQADPNMQDIGDMADAIGAERLRLMVDSGLITQDRADQLSTAYEHYVPLFREMPDNSEMAAIRARGKPGSKKPIRIRKGSSRQVSDVYSNLVTDFQKVIIQSSKNSVFRDFVSELNRVNGGGMFDVNGKSETVDLDAAGNIVTRDTLVTDPNFSISGYVDGKRTYIVAKDGDPLAADVVRAWNNMDAQTIGAFMRRVTGLSRVISKMVTSYSLDFLAANPVRDLQTALWNVTGKEVGGVVSGRAKIARDWVKAFSQIYGHLVFGTRGNYADVFKRMGETGGRMSWLEMFPDEPGKNMAHVQARYDKRWYHPGEGASRNVVMAKNRMLETIGAFFEHLGSASENATRAVVWKAARDAEISRGTATLEAEKRASIIAREVTADFLRHGTQSKKLGALYMFFNPAVQSNVKAVSRIVENPAQRIPALAAAVVASTLLSMLARSWSADDDDDGILNIDEPTVEYSKDRNMVFPIPKEMATLPGGKQAMLTMPVPYFYNIFTTTGNIIGDVISGALKAPTEHEDFNSPAMRAAFRVMNVTLESLSPLGSPFTAGWMQFLSPTIGDLFVQAKDNETAWGTNLYPPKSGAWDKRLMWQRSFRSTPEVYKEAGKAIHDYVFMGGENDEGIGDNLNLELLSNPEVLQNIAQQFGGGFVSLAERTANYAEKGRVQDITGVRRFVTSAEPERDLITKWHAVSTRMDGLNQDLKTATGEQKRELWKTNKDMQLLMRYNDTDKKLTSLRRLKSKAKEGTAQYKKIQDRINEIQSGFIKSYNRMRADK